MFTKRDEEIAKIKMQYDAEVSRLNCQLHNKEQEIAFLRLFSNSYYDQLKKRDEMSLELLRFSKDILKQVIDKK